MLYFGPEMDLLIAAKEVNCKIWKCLETEVNWYLSSMPEVNWLEGIKNVLINWTTKWNFQLNLKNWYLAPKPETIPNNGSKWFQNGSNIGKLSIPEVKPTTGNKFGNVLLNVHRIEGIDLGTCMRPRPMRRKWISVE